MLHSPMLIKQVLCFVIVVFFISCFKSGSEYHAAIEHISCDWKIPVSYEKKNLTDDNLESIASFSKTIDDAYGLKSFSRIIFYKDKSSKESILSVKDMTKNFQFKESKKFILARYTILIRKGNKIIGEAGEVTTLIEKSTGDSLFIQNANIKDFVSGCEMPLLM